jgi:hypothetical protein
MLCGSADTLPLPGCCALVATEKQHEGAAAEGGLHAGSRPGVSLGEEATGKGQQPEGVLQEDQHRLAGQTCCTAAVAVDLCDTNNNGV